MELRSGNIHSSTGAWAFLKEQMDKLPSTMASSRIRLRLDGGFFDKDISDRRSGRFPTFAQLIVPQFTRF
jgi:hypothetical protein